MYLTYVDHNILTKTVLKWQIFRKNKLKKYGKKPL
jgi:hypothetical protein